MAYCVRVTDHEGTKGSTTCSTQTGPNLIVEEEYAVMTRVVTGTGPLCLRRMQSHKMYGDPTLISIYPSDLV